MRERVVSYLTEGLVGYGAANLRLKMGINMRKPHLKTVICSSFSLCIRSCQFIWFDKRRAFAPAVLGAANVFSL